MILDNWGIVDYAEALQRQEMFFNEAIEAKEKVTLLKTDLFCVNILMFIPLGKVDMLKICCLIPIMCH